MSSWLIWYVLLSLSGSPLLALALMLVGGWMLEHYTLGALPTPLRVFRRWSRRAALRRRIAASPHDRRARFELADLLLDGGKASAALPLIRANAEAGDDDPQTLFLLGKACLRAGHLEQGVKVTRAALAEDPKVRQGEGWLELGRALLGSGAFVEARAPLEQFCRLRSGTVEGRVLLARALAGAGDEVAARAVREQAWHEYASSPRYLQRQERLWAWRVRPSRAALYGALAIAIAAIAGWGLSAMPASHPFAGALPGLGSTLTLSSTGEVRGPPGWAGALRALIDLTEKGRQAPGAEALLAAGCHDVFVGDRVRWVEAFRAAEAVGYARNRVIPTSTRPILVECVGETSLDCDAVAARYLAAVGKAPADFTVAIVPGRTPSCVADFTPEGKRL